MAFQKSELVAHGALEVRLDIDVEVVQVVLDEFAPGSFSTALIAGFTGVVRSRRAAWTSHGQVIFRARFPGEYVAMERKIRAATILL